MHKNKSKIHLNGVVGGLVAIASVLLVSTTLYAYAEDVVITNVADDPKCEDSNSCYSPSEITIQTGATVTWLNEGSTVHTITGGNPEDGPNGLFDSGLVLSGQSFSHTFAEDGKYQYFCTVHPWMKGQITVQ